MFTITFRSTEKIARNNPHAISLADLEMLDVVEPTVGVKQILTFSNGKGGNRRCFTKYTTVKPMFEYDPWKFKVRVFIHGNNGRVEDIYEYDKCFPFGSMTAINTDFLWKKLFIPFSFINGEFVLDKKKLKSKKTRKVPIAEWSTTL
jgi:hypothetical protein